MVRDLKVAKKPYCTPAFQILDPAVAKAELEGTGLPLDENARQILSELNQQLGGKTSAFRVP